MYLIDFRRIEWTTIKRLGRIDKAANGSLPSSIQGVYAQIDETVEGKICELSLFNSHI